jgi:uncharacterized protein YjiS (DUF1127 family)
LIRTIRNIRWNNQSGSTIFRSIETAPDFATPADAPPAPTGNVHLAMEARMTTRTISLRMGDLLLHGAYRIWSMSARLWRAWEGRRQVRYLLEADDRMLADIGLSRYDVVGSLSAPADVDPSHLLIRARHERMASRARKRLGC